MESLSWKRQCDGLHTLPKAGLLDLQESKDQQNPIFHHFYRLLIKGIEFIKKCENDNTFNLLLICRHAYQILKLDATKVVIELRNVYRPAQEDLCSMLNDSVLRQAPMFTEDPSHNSMILEQMFVEDLQSPNEMMEDSSYSSACNSRKSEFYVGMENSIKNVKELLFQSHVSFVGVIGIGGAGKTTALSLSNDPQIKGYFGDNILFFTVSWFPNVKRILETMWRKIVGRGRPEFQNAEDAHIQLQNRLLMQFKPTLVILDDVWSRVLEKLLFQGTTYKILVTTRNSSILPQNPSTILYQLPLLSQDDALSLFCFWAFGHPSIPNSADVNLVKQVQAECKGLPLALKVIGSSLRGESRLTWESVKRKLSKGEPISDYHKEGLFRCLETSTDFRDDIARECFLDLAAFPENRKICVEALLHVWVYVRKLEWNDAFVILMELASRNLLHLTSNSGNLPTISSRDVSDLYFYQHDVVRDLALYMGCQESLIRRKRLVMPKKEHSLPGKWELLNNKAFGAQIVSIHTGPMNETHWFEMNFPETQALVLHMTASDYFLPPFLTSMKKLKVLMVFNYGSKRAKLKGLDSLSSLTQLKSIRLERLIASPVLKQTNALPNLEKLSLSLCEGFRNISSFDNTNINLKLPKLQDFNIDHCSELEELPSFMFDMPSARTWSITNCHQVEKLPSELGNLSSLMVLRLSALPGLKELPPSIGKLTSLEYLDISLNECLEELPQETGQLKKLKKIDMRECPRLRKLPRTVCGLTSLRHVICDEQLGNQWLRVKGSTIPHLRVEIVEERFSLDWLDD